MITFKSIRSSYTTKIIISFLTINLIFGGFFPTSAFALPEGPTQPEFNSFTPIGASDMVDLTSGDFSYSIPVLDVGGYPLSLGYSSSTNFDEAASWVGHGWDLSAGQINRSMRVIPDDFDGSDKIKTQNNKRTEETFMVGMTIHPSITGVDAPGSDTSGSGSDTSGSTSSPPSVSANFGLSLQYNNYRGISIQPTLGISFSVHQKFNSSLNFTPTSSDGVSVTGSVGIEKEGLGSMGAGLTYNTFQGFQSLNTSISPSVSLKKEPKDAKFKGISSSFNSRLDLGPPKNFTPTYDLGLTNSVGRIEVAFGGKFLVFGAQFEGYGSIAKQAMKGEYKNKSYSAFGYNNNFRNHENGMLDFTRSFDRPVSTNTSVLSVPQHMYDMYSVSGQGVSGSFKPMKSQVDYIFDPFVRNTSNDIQGGFELLGGDGFGVGVELSGSFSNSSSGKWPGSGFSEHLDRVNKDFLDPNFNRVYYKMVGENTLNNSLDQPNEFVNKIGDKNPVSFVLSSNRNIFWDKYKMSPDSNGFTSFSNPVGFQEIVQENRVPTGKSIQPITVAEVKLFNASLSVNNDVYSNLNSVLIDDNIVKNHHQAGFRITDELGTSYNYVQPLYTVKNISNTFSVNSSNLLYDESLIRYESNDPTINNSKGQDHFVRRKKIPSYVHTSLIKSILSSDYRDLKGNGASPDDLGSYTLFTYKKSNNLNKFRSPVGLRQANFNEGLKSLAGDNKGSYNYGEKQQAFLDRIITKTHVAYFELNDPVNEKREDNINAASEIGGVGNRSRYLKKIYLYSLKQAELIGLLTNDSFDPASYPEIKPLKTVHFEYGYDIQAATGNNKLPNSINGKGKLTLKKLYFTYGESEMGRYTPYEFTYNQDNSFVYHPMNKDVWGNYKPFEGSNSISDKASNTEFPYTTQDKEVQNNKRKADVLAEKFLLSTIKLPSGGEIVVNYESDDYAYVQDQKNMQMFRIAGAGYDADISLSEIDVEKTNLYDNSIGAKRYLYLELEKDSFDSSNISNEDYIEEFKEEYLDELINEPLFFKTLVNVHGTSFKEYMSGYIYLDSEKINNNSDFNNSNFKIHNDELFVSLPIRLPSLNGKGESFVHPFSKATWLYGRQYMPEIAFNGIEPSGELGSLKDELKKLEDTFESLLEVFRSPNSQLRERGSGQIMYTNKSWLRLREPTGFKKGGGARVKSIAVDSNWDLMTDTTNSDLEPLYGQEYSYISENGLHSSGVATNEPHLSNENPLMLPFEDRGRRVSGYGDNDLSKLIDKFLAPASLNYVNGPILKDYYPNSSVTYSRIVVKNLKPDHPDSNSPLTINDKATGHVVHEYYTSKDFPTIEKNSVLNIIPPKKSALEYFTDLIGIPANIEHNERLIASQGFYVETNDMNGKPKSQTTYQEGFSNQYVTKTEYEYQVDDHGLNNYVTQIDRNGDITKQEVGVEYDIVNDFRYSEAETFSAGVDANIYFTPPWFFSGYAQGNISRFNSQMRSVSTAKHVHRTGILKSTTVYDRDSKISTEHLAYDYYSRKPIVTKVNNEFNDVIYNMEIPSHWIHDEMGNSSFNDGMIFKLAYNNPRYNLINPKATNANLNTLLNQESGLQYLINGDEIKPLSGTHSGESFWIDELDLTSESFDLIDNTGAAVDVSFGNDVEFKVVRSAYDNKQAQAISSISLSRNPLTDNTGNLLSKLPIEHDGSGNYTFDESYRIYNASAIEMSDRWDPVCECGYDEIEEDSIGPIYNSDDILINPYFHNLKGQYRPVKSYAFLTGRESDNDDKPILRTDGFYSDFVPFYSFNNQTNQWDSTGKEYHSPTSGRKSWTFASQVSKISPYGLELENKDPLDIPRYSSAMYGFNKKFPSAVASNTEYRELAFDSFEDYDYIEHSGLEHFDFTNARYQSINADDEYISDNSGSFVIGQHLASVGHTGSKSLMIRPDERLVGIEKSMKPCPPGDPSNALMLILNHLWTNRESYGQESCIEPSQLANIPGFNDLLPFIVNNPEGGTPGICDLIISAEGIFFNFYPENNFSQQINNIEFTHDINLLLDGLGDCLDLSSPINSLSLTNGSPFLLSNGHIDTNCSNEKEELYHRMIELNNYCIDCTSFSPHGGKEYYISSWVNQSVYYLDQTTPQGLRDKQPITYDKVKMVVAFYDANQNQLGSFDFKPSGKIINGWQKISGKFITDDEAYIVKIIIDDSSGGFTLVDDIRVHPVNGSMKSFVYDKDNFRLRAELDDNNYATFYEYDNEGNLIRIKKETSRGIMTIQESRQGMSKLNN